MANKILIFPKLADDGTVNGFFALKLVDNGDGTYSAYVVDQADSGAPSLASSIAATGAGLVGAGGAGAGATTALDNLVAVAINTALISDADNTDDLGTAAKRWKELFLSGAIRDGSGNELLKFLAEAGAVNEIVIGNRATGAIGVNGPIIATSGSDASIPLEITTVGNIGIFVRHTVTPTFSFRLKPGNTSQSGGGMNVRNLADTAGAGVHGSSLSAETAISLMPVLNNYSWAFFGTYAQFNNLFHFRWESSYPYVTGAYDLGLNRRASKVLGITDGNTGLAWFVDAGVAKVATQFDKADDTLANVTGLSVAVLAGRTYAFEATLFTSSDAGGGVQAAIGGTATATAIIYEGMNISGGAPAASVVVQSRGAAMAAAVAGVTAVTAALLKISGTIVVNAAGMLTVQFAQNAVHAVPSSVLVGSSFIVRDLG